MFWFSGFVFTSPDSILDTRPGVLKLDECIEACNLNSTCLSVNYETGLCVLFSSSADQTPGKIFLALSTYGYLVEYLVGPALPNGYSVAAKELFRTCNVLPFSCTHLALWRGKEEGLKLWLFF